jgi:uncharacterized protein involved in type VI secretion and phage assembly
MTDLITTLRAIIREETSRHRGAELALVTAVHARDADGSDNNHQVNLRLRDSAVELQHVPVAVGRLGVSMLPRVGDLVVVLFVGGDLNAAVVVGSVYDDKNRPPVGKSEEVVYQPPDPGDSAIRRIHLELSSGSTITVDDDKVTVTSGGTELVINRDGDVTVKAAGKLAFEAQGEISLDAGADLKLSARGNVTISGVAATLEGTGTAKVKAPAISLAGMTQFSPS